MWTPLVHRKIRQTASNTCCRRNTDWLKPPDLTLTDWNYPTSVTLADWNHPTWHWLTETTRPDTDWLKPPDLTDWNYSIWHWLKPPDLTLTETTRQSSTRAQSVIQLPSSSSSSFSFFLFSPFFSSLLCSFPPLFSLWKMVALHWHMTFGRYHGFGDQLYFSLLSLCLFIAVHDGEILHLKCCLNRNCLLQYPLSL